MFKSRTKRATSLPDPSSSISATGGGSVFRKSSSKQHPHSVSIDQTHCAMDLYSPSLSFEIGERGMHSSLASFQSLGNAGSPFIVLETAPSQDPIIGVTDERIRPRSSSSRPVSPSVNHTNTIADSAERSRSPSLERRSHSPNTRPHSTSSLLRPRSRSPETYLHSHQPGFTFTTKPPPQDVIDRSGFKVFMREQLSDGSFTIRAVRRTLSVILRT